MRRAEGSDKSPLLGVNHDGEVDYTPSAPSGAASSLAEIRRVYWRHLKIPMTALFVACLAALAVLVYGSSTVARADSSNRAHFDSLVNAIGQFPKGGYAEFNLSQFLVQVEDGPLHSLVRSADPLQPVVDKNSANTPYNSSVFLHPIRGASAPAGETTISFNFSYSVKDSSNFTSSGKFGVSALYYYIQVQKNSLRQQPSVAMQECNQGGGYYDSQFHNCSMLYVISTVCVAAIPSSEDSQSGWQLSTSGNNDGCVYPFDTTGIYSPYNYTDATVPPLSDLEFTVMIRASDDPYIVLQALTEGSLDLDSASHSSRQKGLYFIIMACLIIAISFSLGLILFYVKRSKKRRYKSSRRIPLHYSRPPVYRFIALALAGLAIPLGIGFPLLGHWSVESTWSYTPFVGLIMIVWAGPVGLIALLICWQMIYKYKPWSLKARLYIISLVAALMLVACVLCVVILIKPWRFDYGPLASQPDYLQVFFGILIVLLLLPLGSVCLGLCVSYFINMKNPNAKIAANPMLSSEDRIDTYSRRAPRTNTRMLSAGIIVLVVVFVATAYLPPIWNVPTVNNYNVFVSPYSLIQVAKSNISTLKLYLDVVVFYGAVFWLGALAVITNRSRRLQNTISQWLHLNIGGIVINTSLGELGFIAGVLALAGWWFWWWCFGYARIAEIVVLSERVARSFGHMCNLFAALLLFPVTRNSMWTELIGIPFERAVKYHRWAGVLAFAFLTLHMLVWWINWGGQGALIHNIFSVQNIPHADNWSIPMMHLTWLGVAVMVLFSQNWFRRKRFELFYYTHHVFIVFFVTGLIHSWSMWYFTGGGMILWFIDRLIRFYRSAKTFTVVSISDFFDGDVTQIIVQANGFTFSAGQYAFVNIPTITPLEWHPFTISSAPGDQYLTFHVKNMAKGSWTARLSRVKGSIESCTDISPVVNVDGPYGKPPDFSDCETVVLVAGGIGITPIISILRDQYNLYRQLQAESLHIKNIYFIWVVRDVSLLEMFADAFQEMHADENKFHIMLYVTQQAIGKGVDNSHITPKPIMGRPNIQQEFKQIALHNNRVQVFVCGPNAMVREVERAAYVYHFDLHTEVFEL